MKAFSMFPEKKPKNFDPKEPISSEDDLDAPDDNPSTLESPAPHEENEEVILLLLLLLLLLLTSFQCLLSYKKKKINK